MISWRSPRSRLLLLSVAALLSLWTLFRLVVQPPPSGTTATGKLNHILTWRPPSSAQANPSGADDTAAAPKEPANRIIVVGKRFGEDTSWLEAELPDWQHAIYSLDSATAPLHTSVNRTSAALLQYLVSNYDSPTFPGFVAFVPAQRYGPFVHEDSWDRDVAFQLSHLQLFWCEGTGYCNLRCAPSPGCTYDAEESAIGVDQERVADGVYEEVWRGLFGGDKERPAQVSVRGGRAGFGVSKFWVTRRSKAEYERMLRFVEMTAVEDEALERVMGDYWHVIFGQEPV